jgi:hypothetical protein
MQSIGLVTPIECRFEQTEYSRRPVATQLVAIRSSNLLHKRLLLQVAQLPPIAASLSILGCIKLQRPSKDTGGGAQMAHDTGRERLTALSSGLKFTYGFLSMIWLDARIKSNRMGSSHAPPDLSDMCHLQARAADGSHNTGPRGDLYMLS